MLKFAKKMLGSQKPESMYEQMDQFPEELEQKKFTVNQREFYQQVARDLKLDPGAIAKDYMKISRGPGRLQFEEYVLYRLFDAPDLDEAAKREFLSESLHWKIVGQSGPMSWQVVTEDKFLSYAYLGQLGFHTPKTVAVLDPGSRAYGATAALRSAKDLGEFLKAATHTPLFAKPNLGLGSVGAALITGLEGDDLQLEGSEPLSIEAAFRSFTKGGAFLLQEAAKNHPDIHALSPHLATIRIMNFLHEGGVHSPFCVLKLPSADNIADNYWRPGNMLAAIDPEKGTIERAVRGKGLQLETLESHPASGQRLPGLAIPHWPEVMAMNRDCALSFDSIRFQSTDIAVTPEGPMMVEVNTGGAFDLPQLASGRGLLTPEVREILSAFGLGQFEKA